MPGHTFRAVLLSLLLSSLAINLYASDDSFAEKKKQFEALFETIPTQSFEGVPFKGEPIDLDYKAFVNPSSKGNVVIVHGFTEHFYKYQELVYDIYNRGYSVYTYNQRGHGSSRLIDEPAVYVDNFEHYVDDLYRLTQNVLATKGQPLVLLGHSMGGAVVARFMERYPNVAEGAILSSPMIRMNTGTFPAWLAEGIASIGVALGFETSLAPGQSLPAVKPWSFAEAGTSSEKRYKQQVGVIYRPDLDSWRRGGATVGFVHEAMVATQKITEAQELQKINKPILLFQAGIDNWVKNEPQNEFCSLIDRCELQVFSKSQHAIYNQVDDIREPYLDKIFKFLESMTQRPVIGVK
ncbi:alpha/beta fold hydrolase [Pseudobacteriovorax antillogorgiicola]|uniref:Lysophospholipase n=1 Tax=Pseudobacteriovorax antillogorgiicola TaxID=1513793 RepID=A0A1Y6CKV2_9BACT|nr:alpha/beta hydrolase [Pseudobacteriovorax antillogorgiicola]TCS45617.1 lysophospholipase [Pseudobacteriovorax antillogorgiicola]SMF72393.1 lysophospholipase [Pseudobacteriovorax antillogorgiicola]